MRVKTVQLDLRCNNHCVFCAQGDLRESEVAPTREAIERELSRGCEEEVVAFVGGEPTLRGDLGSLVSLAKARGARSVLVQTNARALARGDLAQQLRDSGVDRLDVSLHGSTAAMHDYHTQYPGSFADTVRGIRRAKASGLEFALTTVVTRSNFRHLVDIVRVAHTLGTTRTRFLPAKRLGTAATSWERILANPSLAQPFMRAAARKARELGMTLSPDPSTMGWFGPLGTTEPARQRTPDDATETGLETATDAAPTPIRTGAQGPSAGKRATVGCFRRLPVTK